MRILLIEDDQLLQRAVARSLRSIFTEPAIVVVDTADDAIDALAGRNAPPAGEDAPGFDLVISDHDLRRGTGGDVIEWARAAMPDLLDRFVLMSGNETLVDYGVPFIEKPATTAQIRAVVETLAKG